MTNFIDISKTTKFKIRAFISGLHPYFKNLIFLLTTIAVLGFGLSTLSLLSIFLADRIYSLPLCLSNKCFIRFYENFSSAFSIAKSTLDLMVLVATVGAIFVALLSYLSTLKSSYFTNHVSHLTLFQSFFSEEVRKRDLLSISSFDPHRIYGLIYKGSRNGNMSISEDYFEFINLVNHVISNSNFKSFKATKGPFIYKDHQAEMIRALEKIGFNLQFMPKKDFYEIETQIISLLNSISNSFCGGSTRTTLEKRLYR
nr:MULTISPECIES: retron Ec48 family effector membrane protein [unclassified Pseudomonas]